jgi:hypothetical protein
VLTSLSVLLRGPRSATLPSSECSCCAGRAYRTLNQSDQARLAFEEAIAVIETMRVQVAGGEQAQQRFFEDKLSPYHAMVDLLVARNNPTQALLFAERAKARAPDCSTLVVNIVVLIPATSKNGNEAARRNHPPNTVTRASQLDKPDQLTPVS